MLATMRQNIDGLIVKVRQALEAPGARRQRPVSVVNVRIEFQVSRHLVPIEQLALSVDDATTDAVDGF